MNGQDLFVHHGAPVRLRVEKQSGYKSVKFLHRIVVTDEFDDLGKLGPILNGWPWYAGIWNMYRRRYANYYLQEQSFVIFQAIVRKT